MIHSCSYMVSSNNNPKKKMVASSNYFNWIIFSQLYVIKYFYLIQIILEQTLAATVTPDSNSKGRVTAQTAEHHK